MNAKGLTIATAYALCMGLIVVLLKLSLPTVLMAVGAVCAILVNSWKMSREMKAADDSCKTSETLFDQQIVVFTATIMITIGLGLTYILVNQVLDFQPYNIDCDEFRNLSYNMSTFECAERPGKTAVKLCMFLSLIAIMWSLARRYMVREHWDEL